jgi:hypothetical protein
MVLLSVKGVDPVVIHDTITEAREAAIGIDTIEAMRSALIDVVNTTAMIVPTDMNHMTATTVLVRTIDMPLAWAATTEVQVAAERNTTMMPVVKSAQDISTPERILTLFQYFNPLRISMYRIVSFDRGLDFLWSPFYNVSNMLFVFFFFFCFVLSF